jgi:ABC-type bacteriocin/lantibiotic exporter with double-glycine peptidase domain
MSRNTLLIDLGIAVVLAVLVVVISPGLAVVGLLALLVLLICGISFAIDLRRRRRTNPLNDLQRSRAEKSSPAGSRSRAPAPARPSPPPKRAPRGR